MSPENMWDVDPEEDDQGLAWLAPLRDPLGLLRRQRAWIFAAMLILIFLAGVATMLAPMKYEARGTILFTAKSIPDEFVPDTIIANILEQFEAIRGTVFSRERLSKLIVDTNLYMDDRESKPMSALSARLAEELKVEPTSGPNRGRGSPRSIAFEVTMSGSDPEIVANVVNATISELIDANVEYRNRQARVTTEFMRREFDRADSELRAHQRKLAEFRARNRGALPEERESALSKLDRLEEQRRSAILRTSDYRSRLERLDERPSVSMSSDSVESLRERLARARSLYTDEHPTVRSLERQLESFSQGDQGRDRSGANAMLAEERATIEKGIELEQERLGQIDEDVKRLEGLLASAPEVAEDYASLVRREQILRENYVEYLRKLKSAELALSLESAQQGAQLTRLDSAIVPTRPIVPRWLIGLGASALAVAGALGLGVLRELLFPVVIDEEHLKAIVDRPFLGSVSKVAS